MQSVRSNGVVTESTETHTIQTTAKFDALADDQEDLDKVTVNTGKSRERERANNVNERCSMRLFF